MNNELRPAAVRTDPSDMVLSSDNGSTLSPPAVSVKNLTVAYRQQPVLEQIDLEIPQGVLFGIVGPNGAGKSTLIKAILGLVKPISGEVLIQGMPYKAKNQLVAYVPQRGSVDWDFPTDVLDVVMMGTYGRLGWFRWPGRRERDDAMDAIERVGMAEFARRPIGELSGGQQQRVFLARALVQNAPITVMDEPFQGVDAVTERAIVELLRLLSAQQKTVLVVHHDLSTVRHYFDEVVLLNRRKIASGPTETTFTADNLEAAYGRNFAALPYAGRLTEPLNPSDNPEH